jgi:hypothetical protein
MILEKKKQKRGKVGKKRKVILEKKEGEFGKKQKNKKVKKKRNALWITIVIYNALGVV